MRKAKKFNVVSNQQLVDCSVTGCWGCNSGWPKFALDYVLKNGITNDASYPYDSSHPAQMPCSYNTMSMTGYINATYEISTAGNVTSSFIV